MSYLFPKKAKKHLSYFLALQLVILCTIVNASGPQLADHQYIDPKGFFKLVPPDGWDKKEYPQDLRGKVAFLTEGDQVDLRVLVNAVDFSTIDELVVSCENMEKRLGMNTYIKRTELGGRPAVRRTFIWKGSKFLYYDFLIGKVSHNLAYSAPIGSYEKFLPLISKSLETYEPIVKIVSDETSDKHLIAKKKRLAELMLGMGNYRLAIHYADEGLEVDPNNKTLRELRERAESKLEGK